MSESKLNTLLQESNPILSGFLSTLLTADADLSIGQPAEISQDAIAEGTANRFTALPNEDDTPSFGIQLDTAWAPRLASAMLGLEMDETDDDASDLISELVSQGYGALRNAMSIGSVLPEVAFSLYAPGSYLPASFQAHSFWCVPFDVQLDDDILGGTLLLHASLAEALSEPPEHKEPAPKKEPSPAAGPIDIQSPKFPDLGKEHIITEEKNNFSLLAEVELKLTVELGRRKLPLSEVLQLTPGSVIELEKLVGEPLEIYANGRLIAEGEAVVVDEQFGVRITNLANTKVRAKMVA